MLSFSFQKLYSRIVHLSAVDLLLEQEKSKDFFLSRNTDFSSNVSFKWNLGRSCVWAFFSSSVFCPGNMTAFLLSVPAPTTPPTHKSLLDIKIHAEQYEALTLVCPEQEGLAVSLGTKRNKSLSYYQKTIDWDFFSVEMTPQDTVVH